MPLSGHIVKIDLPICDLNGIFTADMGAFRQAALD